MYDKSQHHSTRELLRLLARAVLSTCIVFALAGGGFAKSLYVNRDLNANSPIRAYDIQPAPNYLVFQKDSLPTRYGGVGLAIDTDSEVLFVTFETYGNFDIVDAKTMGILGRVTAPYAQNLAGVVVDQDKQKVYTVDRGTNHLYIYSWDAVARTLTNDVTSPPYFKYLPGVGSSPSVWGAYGLALDEVHDWLFVGDNSGYIVRYFNTSDWSQAGQFTISQRPMGIAVDVKNGLVYTGNAYGPYGSLGRLSKYDMKTGVETSINITALPGGVSSDNVLGLAVDQATGLLYITTGNQGTGGTDRIIAFDSSLNMLYATGDIGSPTGLCVPGKQVSYNPLNLAKNDIVVGPGVYIGEEFTYQISCDNLTNTLPAEDVTITDTLPIAVDFVSATGGGVYNPATHTVLWTIGTIPAGQTGPVLDLVVQVNADAVPGSTVYNYCTIKGKDIPPTTVIDNNANDPSGEPGLYIFPNRPPTVDAGGPYSVDEGNAVLLTAAGSDPDGDALTYEWDLDNDGTFETAGQSVSFQGVEGPALHTVKVKATDPYDLSAIDETTVIVNNVAPDAGAITAPVDAVQVNTAIPVGASFTDPGVLDTHTAFINWGDGCVTAGVVTESGGSGSVSGSHSYTEPGVYMVTLEVIDDDSASDFSMFQYVVIYDPEGGFVTGGGWILSPAGALAADPTLTGKANFGFVSKYQKGATVPTGQTEFNFHVANLNFHSSSYDWLVIAGARAKYKGTGTINGAGEYGFMLTATDGQMTGGGGVDKFRIKIWDKATDAVIYDNQMGDADGGEATDAIEGGSIVIHQAK